VPLDVICQQTLEDVRCYAIFIAVVDRTNQEIEALHRPKDTLYLGQALIAAHGIFCLQLSSGFAVANHVNAVPAGFLLNGLFDPRPAKGTDVDRELEMPSHLVAPTILPIFGSPISLAVSGLLVRHATCSPILANSFAVASSNSLRFLSRSSSSIGL